MALELPICKHLTYPKQIDKSVFIAPGAVVVGDVTLEENVSVWYQAVLRGDIQSIKVGPGSNIQDGAVMRTPGDASRMFDR